MTSGNSSLSKGLHSLPIELRWRICNEILFDQASLPDISILLQSSDEQEGLDRNIKQLQTHAIFSQKRWSYDRLKVHELILKAIKNRNGNLLNALRNQSGQDLITIVSQQSVSALRHAMMHSIFFTEGSAQFLFDGLMFMEKCYKEENTDWTDKTLLERMIEYCIKEESRILLNSCTTSLLLRICSGSIYKQLRSIIKLERHARQTLFQWDNYERLQSHLTTLEQQANRHTWTQALLYEMPITTTVLTVWIGSELYNRNISFACVKVVFLLLLAILGRQAHVAIRREVVKICYNTAYSNDQPFTSTQWPATSMKQRIGILLSNLKLYIPSRSSSKISNSNLSKLEIANTNTDARRPLRTAWLNEVMIKNASHHVLVVESYNAADHYLMTHPFMKSEIKPRQIVLLSSAWDLRGTRIVVKRKQTSSNSSLEYCHYWKRGSTFNIYRKPCLLIPKNGQITVIDDDFLRQHQKLLENSQ